MKILESVLEEKGPWSHLIKKSNRNSNLDCGLAFSQTRFPYFKWTPSIPPHFLVPPFNHSHSLHYFLCIHAYSHQSLSIRILSWSTDQNFLHYYCCFMLCQAKELFRKSFEWYKAWNHSCLHIHHTLHCSAWSAYTITDMEWALVVCCASTNNIVKIDKLIWSYGIACRRIGQALRIVRKITFHS